VVRGDSGEIVAVATPTGEQIRISEENGVRLFKPAAPLELSFNVDQLTERQRELVTSISSAELSQAKIALIMSLDITTLSDAETSALFGTVRNAPEAIVSREGAYYNNDTAAIEWNENGETFRWRYGMSESAFPGSEYFGEVRESGRFGSVENGFELVVEYDNFTEYAGMYIDPIFAEEFPEEAETMMRQIAQYFPEADEQIDQVFVHATSGRRVPDLQQISYNRDADIWIKARVVGNKAFITVDVSRLSNPNARTDWTLYVLLGMISGLDMVEHDRSEPLHTHHTMQGVGRDVILSSLRNYLYARVTPASRFWHTNPWVFRTGQRR
jgi:hypothetical protein